MRELKIEVRIKTNMTAQEVVDHMMDGLIGHTGELTKLTVTDKKVTTNFDLNTL